MLILRKYANENRHVDRDRDLDELIVSSSGFAPSTLLRTDPYCCFAAGLAELQRICPIANNCPSPDFVTASMAKRMMGISADLSWFLSLSSQRRESFSNRTG